ncbi:MAG TPA: hypothetical protein VGW38_29440, partial [Chloroflexota bacterium]|nr:hypothetical protein [Chloroflexota bacterium]
MQDIQLIGHSKGGTLIMELLAQLVEYPAALLTAGSRGFRSVAEAITHAVALSSPIGDKPFGDWTGGFEEGAMVAIGFDHTRPVCAAPPWGGWCLWWKPEERLKGLHDRLARPPVSLPMQVAVFYNA